MQNQLPFETKVKTAESTWLLHECRRLLNLEVGIRFVRTSVSVWRYKDVRRIGRGERGESNPFTPKTSSFVIYWHPMVKLDVHVFKPLTYMYHSCRRRYLVIRTFCTEMWNSGLFRRIVNTFKPPCATDTLGCKRYLFQNTDILLVNALWLGPLVSEHLSDTTVTV